MPFVTKRDSSTLGSAPGRSAVGDGPRWALVACAAVWTVTVVAFSPVVSNELVNWDDLQTLVANDRYRGLSLEHLRWMFTTSFGGHYQPLSWFSFGLESVVWGGVSAVGFHLTNVGLHMLAAAGFFGISLHLIRAALPDGSAVGRYLGATFAAVLFAVHPLRVESVAWATERRDVLSGLFLVLSVLFYLRVWSCGANKTGRLRLVPSVGFFALSLLSKASGVVLPLVLLLIDVYPLRRFSRTGESGSQERRRDILCEKVWYAIPATIIACLAIWAQSGAGALWTLAAHPLSLRISQAFYGIVFYLGKTLWPVDLVPLYEQPPGATPMDAAYLFSMGGVAAITVAVVVLRKRRPSLLCGWACYLVLLAPVLGIAQSGPQLVADRYSYLSCMPWAILAGGVGARIGASKSVTGRMLRLVLPVVCVGLTVALVVATRAQVAVWKDSATLWSTTIARRPGTGLAYASLASVHLQSGEYSLARERAEQALSILPGNRVAHRILGQAAFQQGDMVLAEDHLKASLRIAAELGKFDYGAAMTLADLFVRQDRLDDAASVYRSVVAANPSEADRHFALGSFLGSWGRLDEARASFEQTVRLDPFHAEAWLRLGVVLRALGEPKNAIAAFERNVELDSAGVAGRAELAWALATTNVEALRDGDRALALAESAVRDSGGRSVRAREAYGAAAAETGAFGAAIDTVRGLLADSKVELGEAAVVRLGNQLTQYRESMPVRE